MLLLRYASFDLSSSAPINFEESSGSTLFYVVAAVAIYMNNANTIAGTYAHSDEPKSLHNHNADGQATSLMIEELCGCG